MHTSIIFFYAELNSKIKSFLSFLFLPFPSFLSFSFLLSLSLYLTFKVEYSYMIATNVDYKLLVYKVLLLNYISHFISM